MTFQKPMGFFSGAAPQRYCGRTYRAAFFCGGRSAIAIVLGAAISAAQAASGGPAPLGQGGYGQIGASPRGLQAAAPAGAPPAGSPRGDQTAKEPFPYAYVGAVGEEGAERKIVLERNSRLSIVGRGDVLDRAYRVRVIHKDGVEVYFLSSQVRRFIPFTEIAAADLGVKGSDTPHRPTANEDHGSVADMNDMVEPPQAVTLEKLMGLRPPQAAMETTAAPSRDSMVALPPSEKDPQP